MLQINNIQKVHLELSSYCNARCPGCPRNFYGQKHNDGYVERHLTLANIKTIFKDNFLKQITHVLINGNFGDFIMNPESLEIVKWMRSENSSLKIRIHTNASAQKEKFWHELGKLNVKVVFDIDGFKGTHELYRIGTNFDTVIKNAKTYIAAGGKAVCQFIKFDHNLKEEAELKEYVQSLGFEQFKAVPNTRGHMPVYEDGIKIRDIDKRIDSELAFDTFNELVIFKQNEGIILEDVTTDKDCVIQCESIIKREIYISSLGDVYPCCYLGFEPATYTSGYHKPLNEQFNKYITSNNAIEHDLADCINWFSAVKDSWEQPTIHAGKIAICQDVCGK